MISIFIPTSCQEIDDFAFDRCYKLILLCDPQHTEVGYKVIDHTTLAKVNTRFNNGVNDNEWIKDINQAEEFALHQASSFNPLEEIVHAIVRRQGLQSLKKKNDIGVTPLQYLKANLYANIEEKMIMKQHILDMMGEIVV